MRASCIQYIDSQLLVGLDSQLLVGLVPIFVDSRVVYESSYRGVLRAPYLT